MYGIFSLLIDLCGEDMSLIFPATMLATGALYGDFKFVPYFDSSFQKNALSSFIAHVARVLWDAIETFFRALVISLSLLNPLAWFGLPGQGLKLVDNVAGLAVSALTVVLVPFIVAIRSSSTIFCGYGARGTNEKEENDDLDLTLKIW
jgi:hypothetical protein